MADAAYEAAVKGTFQTTPLRTVLMIDDEFPTFADVIRGEDSENTRKFHQKATALALYEGFQKCHMICDVENDIHDVKAERLRKSDLIILDYHLGPTDGDNEKSIKLLRELSNSKHFNTIVVYTKETDLDKVWLHIISSLAGGWTTLPASLTGTARTEWDRLSDNDSLPKPQKEAIMQFACRSRLEDIEGAIRESAVEELVGLEVPLEAHNDILRAMIHVALADHAGPHAGSPRHRAVGGYSNDIRWVQANNAFVVVVQKKDIPTDPTAIANEGDPAGIMAALEKALLAWHPNFFQILISEIQNVLELEALTTADALFQAPETQTALWYYLLESLGKVDVTTTPDVNPPLVAVVDKIIDGVRRKLMSDQALLTLASEALLGNLKETGWTAENWPDPSIKMFEGAAELAGTSGLVSIEDVMFRLNSFFSTEEFGRAHLTTGTIFCSADGDTHWVTTSPACDLVRRAGAQQKWSHAIYPVKAIIAIRVEPYPTTSKALKESTNGSYIFLEKGNEKKVFKLLNDGGFPSYEFIFAQDGARVRNNGEKIVFKAARFLPNEEHLEGRLVSEEFEIVGQLRGLNSNRALQHIAQHLSRIGLDFVGLPKS